MRFLALILLACAFASASCSGEAVSNDEPDLPVEAPDSGLPDLGHVSDAGSDAQVDAGSEADAGDDPCPAGLGLQGSECVSQIPRDPDFTDSREWSSFGGAILDDGLTLGRDAICSRGGSGARQSISLGEYDDVGPLLVTVDLRYDLCDDPGLGECEPSSILFVRSGESVIQIPTPFGLQQAERSVSFCLPVSAYGGENDLAVWVREYDENACRNTNERTVTEAIESLRIQRTDSATCPSPGVVTNPEFEEDFAGNAPRGWFVNKGGTGDVVVRDNDGDLEVSVVIGTGCSNAQMQQKVRAPVPSDPNSGIALEFEQRTTPGTPLQLRFGPLQRYLVDLEPGVQPICLPSYLWGRAEELLFRVTGSAECNASEPFEAVIDDIRFTERPECGPTGEVRNGAFQTDIFETWNVSVSGPGATAAVPEGETYARLEAQQTCGAATVEQWITPLPQFTAVSFEYRATEDGTHGINLRPLALSRFNPFVLSAAADWTPVTYCLPREPRLPVSIAFTEFAPDSTCDLPTKTTLEVRNVELTSDPNCGP